MDKGIKKCFPLVGFFEGKEALNYGQAFLRSSAKNTIEQGYRRAVNRRDSEDSHNSKKLKGNRDGQQKVQVGRITDVLQAALSADNCGPGE